jgi:hypothetical protein
MAKPNGNQESGATAYGIDQIKVLEGLEAVRKRPAMYIGGTGPEGLHHLVFEVLDNSVDEALAGACDRIEVTIHIDNSVTVTDNGRGIPVDIHEQTGRPGLEVVMTTLHAGGKFGGSAYKVSGGLHGVGVSVVNALSEWLEAEVWVGGKKHLQRYERGKPTGDIEEIGKARRTGTRVTFLADGEVFEDRAFSWDTLSNRLREMAFLNKGLRIVLADERADRREEFYYTGGIKQFVELLNANKTTLHPRPIYIEAQRDDTLVEIALQYNDGYAETVFSFANNINTQDARHRLPVRPHPDDQQLCVRAEPAQGPEGQPLWRRRPGGPHGRPQRAAPQPAVRGTDQGAAQQPRHQGPGGGGGQREAGGTPGREPRRRPPHRGEGRGGGPGPGGRPQGQGAGAAQGGPGRG